MCVGVSVNVYIYINKFKYIYIYFKKKIYIYIYLLYINIYICACVCGRVYVGVCDYSKLQLLTHDTNYHVPCGSMIPPLRCTLHVFDPWSVVAKPNQAQNALTPVKKRICTFLCDFISVSQAEMIG